MNANPALSQVSMRGYGANGFARVKIAVVGEILNNADAELIIPMNPKCESLNAAVAATIVMWQMKQ